MSARLKTPTPSIISVKHAAYLVEVSESTILRLIHRGELPAKYVRRKYRIYSEDVRVIIQKYKMQATESRKYARGMDIPSNRIITFDDYIETHRLVKQKDKDNISNTAVTF
jgi:excisionase family DNA binding protein